MRVRARVRVCVGGCGQNGPGRPHDAPGRPRDITGRPQEPPGRPMPSPGPLCSSTYLVVVVVVVVVVAIGKLGGPPKTAGFGGCTYCGA